MVIGCSGIPAPSHNLFSACEALPVACSAFHLSSVKYTERILRTGLVVVPFVSGDVFFFILKVVFLLDQRHNLDFLGLHKNIL